MWEASCAVDTVVRAECVEVEVGRRKSVCMCDGVVQGSQEDQGDGH